MHFSVVGDPMIKMMAIDGIIIQTLYIAYQNAHAPGKFYQAVSFEKYPTNFTMLNRLCKLMPGDSLLFSKIIVILFNNRKYTRTNLTAVVLNGTKYMKFIL